jgi:hypothetical protein
MARAGIPQLTIYPSEAVLQSLEQYKVEMGCKSLSQAAVQILTEHFKEPDSKGFVTYSDLQQAIDRALKTSTESPKYG